MSSIKKIIASTLLVGSMVMGGQVATAKTPSDSSLVQLAKVSQFDTTFKDGLKAGFVQSMVQGMLQRPDLQALSPQKQAQAKKVIEKFANNIIDGVNVDGLSKVVLDDFIKISKKHFTQKEVDAMIKFYSTPEGKSIIAKQNAVMNELMSGSMSVFMNDEKFAKQIEANFEKYGDTFEKEMDALFQ